jgi:nucleoside-diphosphate-sugar epimerase
VLRRTGCAAFISVGSQAEYGKHSGVLHEDLPAHPITAYGVAKLALHMLARQLCSMTGMRFVWLRLLSAYGPADDERHMVPMLIRSLLRGETPLLTEGEQIWDYLYISDVAEAMLAVLESDAQGLFNLASGCPCRLRDFVSNVRDNIDPALPLGFGKLPYRPDQVMHLEGDITRLKLSTGWAPRIGISEGIRRTVAWYKGQVYATPA